MVRELLWFYWTFKTTWLQMMKRLYVFRSAPTWFVEEVAEFPLDACSDANIWLYTHEARRELELRGRRAIP